MPQRLRAPHDADELSWRVLGLLNLFRLLVPVVLLVAFYLPGIGHIVGDQHPALFRSLTYGYLAIGIGLIAVLKQRTHTADWHVYAPVILDIVLLALIVYSSGGAESGLGVLLVAPVAGLSVLSGTRGGLLTAAAAVFALLGQQLASLWLDGTGWLGLAQSGYYGAVLFVVATGGVYMARRLRETEDVIRQRDIDLANLAELSEYIVQHLRESIVVIDAENRVRLINPSARSLLGPEAEPGALLGEIAPKLLFHVESWRQRPEGAAGEPAHFVAADGAHEVEAHFAALGRERPASLIAFLADSTELAARVQQTKLAALGRLSASIAHEIRNPVGAMSHAAQLLAESPAIPEEERRLTQIITQNGERVSTIITNVLRLSRREETHPERLRVGEWLGHFLDEFRATLELPAERFRLAISDPGIEVRMDPSHLRQIVWNLCENAVRHSGDVQGAPAIDLILSRFQSSGRPFLEIADRGPGIPDTLAERIFEPFFSGRRGGTGLGLFIARELAQCNGAVLIYEPRADGGCIFRIVFADPQRWEGRADG